MRKQFKNSLILLLSLLLIALTACGGAESMASVSLDSAVTETQGESPSLQGSAGADLQGTLEVHFLDVGQADSTLIRLPEGENILIDGGNRDDKDYILHYLETYNVEQLDLVVATHPHEDHIGSLRDVISLIPTTKILLPTVDADTLVYTNLLYAIEENGVTEERILGQENFQLGGVEFQILGPVKDYGNKSGGALNNASIVIRMVYGENTFLFTGDMEKEAEQDILDTGVTLQSDVLKVAHHGSKTSNTEEFINAVNPKLAVIHVGENNKYGLPDDSVAERLISKGITLYRTDENKEIIIVSDGKNLTVETGFEALENDIEVPEENIPKETEPGKDIESIPDETQTESFENSNLAEPAEEIPAAITDGIPAFENSNQEDYIGNMNSKIYHTNTCGSLPAEKNRIYFDSAQSAEDAGYTGHKTCVK